MLKKFFNKIESILKYQHFASTEDGSYRFLVDKVYKSTDIDFIESVWQLDYFRELLVPQPADLTPFRKVLVLAPHQDDESIGCGGTLLKLREQGCKLTIGFLTDGRELSRPEKANVDRRKEEARKVCEALGAEMRSLDIDNTTMAITSAHTEELNRWLQEGWDAVFTVWPLDQPPKHRLCSYLVGS